MSPVSAPPHLVEGPVGTAHLHGQSRFHIPPSGQAAHGAATASDSPGGGCSRGLGTDRARPSASPRRRSRRGSRGGREPGRPHRGPATANEQGAGAGPLPVRRRRLGLRHREGNGRRRRCLRHFSFRPPPPPLLPQTRDPLLPLLLHGLHLPLPPPPPPTAQARRAPARRARNSEGHGAGVKAGDPARACQRSRASTLPFALLLPLLVAYLRLRKTRLVRFTTPPLHRPSLPSVLHNTES